MHKHYYLARNGQQSGPFVFEQLRHQTLYADTLVWWAGLPAWLPAGEVPELRELLTSQTAPPPPFTAPPPVPGGQTHFGYTLAGVWERLLGELLYSFIIALPFILFLGWDNFFADNDYFSMEAILGSAILEAILGAICYPLLSGHIGHRIMGLKVISAENGRDMNRLTDGALRELLKSLLGNLLVPLMWLLWDDNRQNLYDKVVKTFVVKRKP